jgi:3-oxoacyl-[acyl-carrier protein] reductase
MQLGINKQLFLVGGASSGFGLAIATGLLAEGARVIAVARDAGKLETLYAPYPGQAETAAGDITETDTLKQLTERLAGRTLHGIVVNAGGPPAKTFLETTLSDWDAAYKNLLRWKIALTQLFIPPMIKAGYGRMLYIESSSVKQPLENLVLSNSIRLATVGFVKTLSQEIAASGVTLNILAPGSHNTPAIERVYKKKSEQVSLPESSVREQAIQQIPVKRLGNADDFASLALWLLSPASGYITGQTITVDGGMVKGTFG